MFAGRVVCQTDGSRTDSSTAHPERVGVVCAGRPPTRPALALQSDISLEESKLRLYLVIIVSVE